MFNENKLVLINVFVVNFLNYIFLLLIVFKKIVFEYMIVSYSLWLNFINVD